MPYQNLYRKYRPSNFDKLYGQEVAKKVLQNTVKSGEISHAYMFFGPRGTGKTSMAKLFAKAINCLQPIDGMCCENCINCIQANEKECVDIIEIDAASNNGVDEIRELKNKINLVPNSLKYKVYIIDEVHMLSIGAFNALLKTLEEPPEHIVFILATTEFYKVPQTIISRCQVIEFKSIDNSSMQKRLVEISGLENILIDESGILEIVKNSNGGLRDALGLLDKVRVYSDNNITSKEVKEILGLISNDEIDEFVDKLIEKKYEWLLDKISYYADNGRDLLKIVDDIVLNLRNKIVFDKMFSLVDMINKVTKYQSKMKMYYHDKLYFELMVIDLCDKTNVLELKKQQDQVENISREIFFDGSDILNISREIKNDSSNQSVSKKTKKCEAFAINFEARINNSFVGANKSLLNNIKKKWSLLNDYTFDIEVGSICCDLIDCTPVVCSEKNLMLSTQYKSCADKINENYEVYQKILLEKLCISQVVVVIDDNKWDTLKKQYLDKLKNNQKYEYIPEFIGDQSFEKNDEYNSKNDIIDKAKDLFGTIIIN